MNFSQLQTPAALVDLSALEQNIRSMQELCDRYEKELWPMIKTHKSTRIALMQQEAGAQGFLAGTLDECEALADAGIKKVMYAYPIADRVAARRAAILCSKCDFIVRLDCEETARALSREIAPLLPDGASLSCTIIVDSGLGRFGAAPHEAPALARILTSLPALRLRGISTHPGHVYGCSSPDGVLACAADEIRAIRQARDALEQSGFPVEIASSGSTPTVFEAVKDSAINVFHPGNYVFNDCIQMALGAARQENCSLSVLATVISRPAPDRLLLDAGAKCLGLDKGAHGNSSISGYGLIKGHPELTIVSLSEEVGKVHIQGETVLKPGDRVEIIPNHACSAANLTSVLIGVRDGEACSLLKTDMRGNSTDKGVAL